MEINIDVAKKVLSTIDAGLVRGVGNPVPGQMCVEAAVCYALDLPHGDDPGCVSQGLRSLKITLNDSRWSSDKARTKGLRRLGLAQLGSKGVLDEKEFGERCAILSANTSVPDALRSAASIKGNAKYKDSLLACIPALEAAKTTDEVKIAAYAANAAANAAAYAAYAANAANAAAYAANAAAYAANAAAYAANAAAYAANAAAAYAANAAANAANAAAAYAAAYAANADETLSRFAEGVVQILITMNAPGVQWLHLTEESK